MKHYYPCNQTNEDGTVCEVSVSFLATSCGEHDIPPTRWTEDEIPAAPSARGDWSNGDPPHGGALPDDKSAQKNMLRSAQHSFHQI